MVHKLYVTLCCLLPICGYSQQESCRENTHTINLQDKFDALFEASHRYLDFINRISKGDVFPQAEIAATLIAPDCKKVLNGQLFTQNREDFVADLLSVYENQGAWNVHPVDIIVSSSGNSVVLRLIIEMEKVGTYTAMVILRYNANFLITEINEVLSKVNGSYDFIQEVSFHGRKDRL